MSETSLTAGGSWSIPGCTQHELVRPTCVLPLGLPGMMSDVATYAAFLRGVNLGPNNKIPMPALRAMAEDLGYTGVATYINSGNLIITSAKKAATLEREISSAIKDTFGRPIDVAV